MPALPSPPSTGPSFAPVRSNRAARWARGTAGKAFLIMMLVLLPLAIATITVNWHSIRIAEQEKTELLAAATRQNAIQLASDIGTIHTAQTMTANLLASEQAPGNVCDRMQRLFNAMAGGDGIVTAIFDAKGTPRCQSTDGQRLREAFTRAASIRSDMIVAPDLGGLLIRSASDDGSITAFALYLRPALRKLTSARASDPTQSVSLHQGDRTLLLSEASDNEREAEDGDDKSGSKNRGKGLTTMARVGTQDLMLSMTVTDSTSLGARIVPLLMPLLLWVAAAFLGWLVVRWILIQPLMTLRREVAAYTPGQVIQPPHISRLASREIVELGESFHAMSRDVAEHEADMQAALDRQTRLTREVHHRVKNNLQIISSLISLHWRAATDPKVGEAYLSIQRRVDALAVVQRNHYAELDEKRGVRARPMMNEIASGLKISAQVQSGRTIDIAVDCDDVTLHQDVAAPIAFMTAELADLVIALDPGGRFTLSLIRLDDDPAHARLSLIAPVFCRTQMQEDGTVPLHRRVPDGLARQLRAPLGHDAARGEYHIIVPVTG